MNANPYSSPKVPRCANTRAFKDPRRRQFILPAIAVCVWQSACLLTFNAFKDLLPHVTNPAYALVFGTPEAHLELYTRLVTYIRFVITTFPASILTIVVVEKLSGSKSSLNQKVLALAFFQLVTMLVLGIAYEFSFYYMLNELRWWLFGMPDEVYSFQNLILPRVATWLFCTTPIVWLAARSYSANLGSYPADFGDQDVVSARDRASAPSSTTAT